MKQISFLLTSSIICAFCTLTPMDKMEPNEYQVLDAQTADFSSLGKFDPMLENYGDLLFFLDKSIVYRVASISYPTVDPNNNPITASGLVYHPISRKSKGVIDVLPTARLEKDGGSSEKLYAVEGMMALLGYTVIFPDLIGFGTSKEAREPFLMSENTGRVAYDMRRAASQYLRDQFGYDLPAETVIMGYSLGGSAALATQKYYETYHPNTVKVKEVYAGGGAYDLPVAFSEFARTGISDYPAIPNAILAFDHYYHLQADFTQLFKGELLENYQDWFSGKYSSTELRQMMGTNPHTYMHDDFFKPLDQQNDEFKKFYPYLKENSVSEGWTPKATIHLYHAKVDRLVPEACAEAAVSKLRKAGGTLTYVRYPGDHYTVGYLYFIRSVIHFL